MEQKINKYIKDMEQFSRSLLSSEFPVTESFWQDVFTFRSKSLSVTKLSQEFDHYPPKKLMLLKSQSCQPLWQFFLLGLWPWACVSAHGDSPGPLWPVPRSAGHLWLPDNVKKPWPLGYELNPAKLDSYQVQNLFLDLIYLNASLAHHHFSLALSSLQLPPSQRVKPVLS